MADDTPKKEQALIKLGEFINNTFSALLMMKSELSSIQASLLFQMESWERQREEQENRISIIEDVRKSQLLATDAQIKKIDELESKGFSLTDKTFVPHILGTVQVIHEELAKLGKCVEQMIGGQSSLDDRLITVEMDSKVHFAKQQESTKLMADRMAELISFDKLITGRLMKLLMVALIIISGFAGLGQVFEAIRGI